MNFFKLIISYDGTDFLGWQSQTSGRTVQDSLVRSFRSVFGRQCSLLAASRTDAGVHAEGQVVRLRTDLDLPEDMVLSILNSSLRPAIRVESLRRVDGAFNPHKNIDHKIYRYTFYLKKPHPQSARWGWIVPCQEKVSWPVFRDCLPLFQGRHDFSQFCRIEPDEDKDPVRTVDSIDSFVDPDLGILTVVIKGHSFLRYQIRRMLGAAFQVARKRNADGIIIKQALATGLNLPPEFAFKLPAAGLCLNKIVYQ